MPQRSELPTPRDCQEVLQAIETWKRYFDPNLPGGPATLDELTESTDRIVAYCDLHASPMNVEPLAHFKEVVLEGLRNGQTWHLTPEGRLAHSRADGLCNRIKTWLQSGGAEVSKTSGKRRGRKRSTDVKADERIGNAWKNGHYRRYEDLGRELHLSGLEVKRAIDRQRKRSQ